MSLPDAFPTVNPFPILGTFTIAGERRNSEKSNRWIPRLPVLRLIEQVTSYRLEFAPAWKRAGRTVLLRGPHGSGKTHTIYAALQSAEEPLESDAPGKVFAVYTIHQDDNFFEWYRQIIARVNQEPGLWKKLAQLLLARLVDRATQGWRRR